MTAAVTIRIQEADFDIAQEIAALTQGAHRYRRGRQLLPAFAGAARTATPSPR